MELSPRFVNREEALKEIAEHITHFVRTARYMVQIDTRRSLRSLFSAGTYGWGKSALGSQAVLQFSSREQDLLEGNRIDTETVKSTWLCYVDLDYLDGDYTSST